MSDSFEKKKKLSEEESAALYRWMTERWGMQPKLASDFCSRVKDQAKLFGLHEAFWREWVLARRAGMMLRLEQVLNPKFDDRQKELF